MKSTEENEIELLERWFSKTNEEKIGMIKELQNTAISLTMSTPKERFILVPTLKILFMAIDEEEGVEVRVASAIAIAEIVKTNPIRVGSLY